MRANERQAKKKPEMKKKERLKYGNKGANRGTKSIAFLPHFTTPLQQIM
jgi:hypothetical protein